MNETRKFTILIADDAETSEFTRLLQEKYGKPDERKEFLNEKHFTYWSEAYEFISREGGSVEVAWMDFVFSKPGADRRYHPEFQLGAGGKKKECHAQGLLLLLLLRSKRPGPWPFYLYAANEDSVPDDSFDAEILFRYLHQAHSSSVIDLAGKDPRDCLTDWPPRLFRAARAAVVAETPAFFGDNVDKAAPTLSTFQGEVRKAILAMSAKTDEDMSEENISTWEAVYHRVAEKFPPVDYWTCETFFPLEFLALHRAAECLRSGGNIEDHRETLMKGLGEMCSDWRPITGLFNRECLSDKGCYQRHVSARGDFDPTEARRRWVQPALHLSAILDRGNWKSLAGAFSPKDRSMTGYDWARVWCPENGISKLLEASNRVAVEVKDALRSYTLRDYLSEDDVITIKIPNWVSEEGSWAPPEEFPAKHFLTHLAEWGQILLDWDFSAPAKIPGDAPAWWHRHNRSSLLTESCKLWTDWKSAYRQPLSVVIDWDPGPLTGWESTCGTVAHTIRLYYADNGPGVENHVHLCMRARAADGGLFGFVLPRSRVWASEIRMYWKCRHSPRVFVARLDESPAHITEAIQNMPQRIWDHFTNTSGACFEFSITYPKFEEMGG